VDITNTRPNVEQDVKTPSGHKTLVGKSSKSTPSEYKSEEKSTAADVDYKIIESAISIVSVLVECCKGLELSYSSCLCYLSSSSCFF
jgi:hypothetical protein